MPSAHLFIHNVRLKAPKKGKVPDFIIAGIEKSGTTSLFVHLSKHPAIEMVPHAVEYMKAGKLDNMKEPHFFNKRWTKGLDWYRGLFNDNDKLQGEAASNYLFKEEYIKRMSSVAPHAKIIVALRDPVARAYSQYVYSKELYRKLLPGTLSRLRADKDRIIKIVKLRDISFDEAIKIEIKKGISAGTGNIGKGLYIDLLGNLLKYYPRRQILFIISERMKADMSGTYNNIFDFLGLEATKIDFEMDVLAGKYEKPMSSWARETLSEIYGPYNERLSFLLGHKIDEWGVKDECASVYS